MEKHLIVPVFALMSCLVSAQDINVSAGFDSSTIYIGDQIHFTITVEKPAGTDITLPVQKDTLLKHVEIIKGPVTDSAALKDGRIRIVQRYLVTSFDSGFYQVPPQYAELKTAGGIKRFYSGYSPLVVMRVKIRPPDKTMKIFDIVEPYKAPLTAGEILSWVFLFILIIAAIWYLIRLIRRYRRRAQGDEQPLVNPDPAHVIALRDLEKLKEEKLWQRGEVKLYYTRLTEIVRQYLENRFRIQSLELTTIETLSLLKNTGFREDEVFHKLKSLLTGADLVKFAKYRPDPGENELNYENAWDFVSLTRVVEEPVVMDNVKTVNTAGV